MKNLHRQAPVPVFSKIMVLKKDHKTESNAENKFCQISNSLITVLLEGRNTSILRQPAQNRSFSSCSSIQTPILTGSDDRIEPNYFQHKNVDFSVEKKSFFFGSPGCVPLLRASLDQKNEPKKTSTSKNDFLRFFNDEKIDFYKKESGNLEIVAGNST